MFSTIRLRSNQCNSNGKGSANRPSRRRPLTGATAVEFALVSPLVIFFFFGAVELCRTNIVRHMADNAAYEAARVAIAPGATSDEAIAEAERVLRMAGIRNAQVNLNPATLDESTLNVNVSVSVPMKGNGWLPGLFTRGISVGGEASLKTERAPLAQALAIPVPPPTTTNPPKKTTTKKSGTSKKSTTKKPTSKKTQKTTKKSATKKSPTKSGSSKKTTTTTKGSTTKPKSSSGSNTSSKTTSTPNPGL